MVAELTKNLKIHHLQSCQMPVKISLTGDCVGYDLSSYQMMPKPLEQTKRRFYSMNRKAQTLIMSSTLNAAYNRPKGLSLCFGTFTFNGNLYNPLYNDEISYFFEYASRQYGLHSYLWTKELTIKKTIHYHAIFTMETGKGIVKRLNRTWCNARGYFTTNAFRTDSEKGLIIKDPERAAAYAAKYSSKSDSIKFPSPIYRISNKMICKPIRLNDVVHSEIIEHLHEKTIPIDGNSHFVFTDYAKIFKTDRKTARIIFDSLK